MKKIAMLGDLHGNLTATLAMEKALKDYHVDEIWFLGDAVGKGPQSRETCDWVRANCTRFVGGNWDYGIGGKRFAADNYFWDQLGEERMNWLNTLPLDMDEWISGTHFRFFHGRPVTDLMLVQHDKSVLAQPFTANGTEITDISRTPGSREPKSPSTITAWAFGTPMLLPTLPVLTM